MDNNEKKELAAKMAAQRSGAGGRKPLPSAPKQNSANSMSFFGDDADGWQMSPKTILLFSVAFMGAVILLHIFGKVSSMKKGGAVSAPESSADDL